MVRAAGLKHFARKNGPTTSRSIKERLLTIIAFDARHLLGTSKCNSFCCFYEDINMAVSACTSYCKTRLMIGYEHSYSNLHLHVLDLRTRSLHSLVLRSQYPNRTPSHTLHARLARAMFSSTANDQASRAGGWLHIECWISSPLFFVCANEAVLILVRG